MNTLKTLCQKLLFPPIFIQLILAVISIVSLVYVFANDSSAAIFSYAVYVLSAYTLTVIVLTCIKILPEQIKKLKEKMHANKYTNRYLTDAAFRTHISLYGSLAVNLLYAAINLYSYYYNRSAWFVILTAYYSILALMRFLLVKHISKSETEQNLTSEFKRARICSCILLLLNFILTGAVLMILYQNKGFVYPGVMIYAMALYTFYMTINSAVSIFRHRKSSSPVITTAKIISLAAALVSMLSLETAMLAEFAADVTDKFNRVMIASTGAGVSVIIITLSIIMILKSNKAIKENRTA